MKKSTAVKLFFGGGFLEVATKRNDKTRNRKTSAKHIICII